MFSCEICEVSKKAFFMEHLWVTASESLSRKIFIKETYFKISETKPLLNTALKKKEEKKRENVL